MAHGRALNRIVLMSVELIWLGMNVQIAPELALICMLRVQIPHAELRYRPISLAETWSSLIFQFKCLYF